MFPPPPSFEHKCYDCCILSVLCDSDHLVIANRKFEIYLLYSENRITLNKRKKESILVSLYCLSCQTEMLSLSLILRD